MGCFAGGYARSTVAQLACTIRVVLTSFRRNSPLSHDCLTAQCPTNNYCSVLA